MLPIRAVIAMVLTAIEQHCSGEVGRNINGSELERRGVPGVPFQLNLLSMLIHCDRHPSVSFSWDIS